jgi:hypothetical protein
MQTIFDSEFLSKIILDTLETFSIQNKKLSNGSAYDAKKELI